MNGVPMPAVVPAASAASLFAPISSDLRAVDDLIHRVSEVDNSLLQQTLRLTLSASGKRLRPALTLLAAHLHENTLQRRAELAVAAELLHTATLVHDDVIDLADSRRGHPTVNATFGNTLAVLTGDYLFGKSGELVAGLGSPPIMGVFSWAVMQLVQGEMFRPMLNGDLRQTEREYYAKIEGKTASLLAMCCQTGAMLDAEQPEVVARLRAYGLSLGMAFQIVDDVLDFTASEEQLGKPVGSDLRSGTITLPSIYFLRRHPGHAGVMGLLTHDEAVLAQAEDVVEAIRASSAVQHAMDEAKRFAAQARRHLDGLPSTPYLDALRQLTFYVVERHE